MDLSELPGLLPTAELRGEMRGPVSGLSYNSKTMNSGELFFCLRGTTTDGHQFAAEAVERGAVGLVVEEFLPLGLPQIRVADARAALWAVGRRFYGYPAARVGLVGITGTNGKTTVAFFTRALLKRLGGGVGLIGTVYNQLSGPPEPSALTTPEPADLWRLLSRAARERCDWVVMEVSSHALALHRVDPADLDIAVVTNITRDHFEFHGTFEHYWQSKARIVREMTEEWKGNRPKAAVLFADDPQVMRMAEGAAVPVITFGIERTADIRATEIEERAGGSDFMLHLPGATPTPVFLPMPGRFNVANALAAATVAWLTGVTPQQIAAGMADCRAVPGRAERIEEGQPFEVLVDFAHNPDAVAKIVSLRPPGPEGRRILVFGAEGGKDPGKRPEMGAAARGADLVIVTSDNVHKEEPDEIAAQVASGLGPTPHEVIVDRRAAIARALELARPGDLVIIAGKGHEQTWVYGGERRAFDDREVARELLRMRAGSSSD